MLELPTGDMHDYLSRTVMEINRTASELGDMTGDISGKLDTATTRIAELDAWLTDLEARVEALENA